MGEMKRIKWAQASKANPGQGGRRGQAVWQPPRVRKENAPQCPLLRGWGAAVCLIVLLLADALNASRPTGDVIVGFHTRLMMVRRMVLGGARVVVNHGGRHIRATGRKANEVNLLGPQGRLSQENFGITKAGDLCQTERQDSPHSSCDSKSASW